MAVSSCFSRAIDKTLGVIGKKYWTRDFLSITLDIADHVRCSMRKSSLILGTNPTVELSGAEMSYEHQQLSPTARKPPGRVIEMDPLLTAEEVAKRLNVSTDWVWDHSSRKAPYLPAIRISDGVLRYRSSEVDEFIHERERLSSLRLKRR